MAASPPPPVDPHAGGGQVSVAQLVEVLEAALDPNPSRRQPAEALLQVHTHTLPLLLSCLLILHSPLSTSITAGSPLYLPHPPPRLRRPALHAAPSLHSQLKLKIPTH